MLVRWTAVHNFCGIRRTLAPKCNTVSMMPQKKLAKPTRMYRTGPMPWRPRSFEGLWKKTLAIIARMITIAAFLCFQPSSMTRKGKSVHHFAQKYGKRKKLIIANSGMDVEKDLGCHCFRTRDQTLGSLAAEARRFIHGVTITFLIHRHMGR